jgi:flagellar hook-associated protein 3 FlgL
MKTSFVSTYGLYDAMRSSVSKLQTQVVAAQKEATTNRPADVGLTLGYQTGTSVTLREEVSRLQTIQDSNALVNTRLQAAQNSISAINEDRQTHINNMITALGSGTTPITVEASAKLSLDSMISAVNTSVGNDYVFSGANTDVKPINAFAPNASDTSDPPSTSFGMLDKAFKDFVNSKGGDASKLTADDMNVFLQEPDATNAAGTYSQLFEGDNWAKWSNIFKGNPDTGPINKSPDPVRYRISTSQTLNVPVNADDGAFRNTAKAYAMLSYLNQSGVTLSQDAFKSVVSHSLATATDTTTDTSVPTSGDHLNNNKNLTALQAQLGSYQQSVTNSTSRMNIQSNLMSSQLENLEQVDPYSAATKVNALMTQLNAAYALTAQIQKLSILNYIS